MRHRNAARWDNYRLRKFVRGSFDMIMGSFIIVNTVILCAQLQFEGYLCGVELGVEKSGQWNRGADVFRWLELSISNKQID